MIRLGVLPLLYAAYRTVRIMRTPWCQILSHDPVMDAESGLMCRRCGHVVRTVITPPKDDR